jgi:hypothetical protein
MPPDGPHDTEFADDTIELLTRARAGDRTALDRLFDHHVPRAFASVDTLPCVGSSSPASTFKNVVLPEPFAPMSP